MEHLGTLICYMWVQLHVDKQSDRRQRHSKRVLIFTAHACTEREAHMRLSEFAAANGNLFAQCSTESYWQPDRKHISLHEATFKAD